MADDSKTLWYRFGAVATFLGAVATFAQLCSAPKPDNPNPVRRDSGSIYSYPDQDLSKTSRVSPRTSPDGIAYYCCDTHSGDRVCKLNDPAPIGKNHIPTDLVVAQEASAVESSSRLDFLLLHNLGTNFVAP